MSSIIRSVRKLMPNAEGGREESSNGEESSTEFRAMAENTKMKAPKSFLRARSFSRGSSSGIDKNYVEAPDAENTQANNNKALSPTSPSSANQRYQLMDNYEPEEQEEYQVPSSLETETIEQSLHRIQRRVSDSWKSLQGVSKRLIVGPTANAANESTKPDTSSYLLPETSLGDMSESREEVEETGGDRRLFRKAMRSFKRSLSRQSVEDEGRIITNGYVRTSDNSAVVFSPRKDMEIT